MADGRGSARLLYREFLHSALILAGVLEPEGASENARLLLDRIGSLNQLSLRTKLEDLLQLVPYPSLLIPVLGNSDDPEVFLREFTGKVVKNAELSNPPYYSARATAILRNRTMPSGILVLGYSHIMKALSQNNCRSL
jgi:hypothetical protein